MNYVCCKTEIDMWALMGNYLRLAPRCMPVLKSNAYGHGLLPCASSLVFQANCRHLCVGYVDEAVTLRVKGLLWPELLPLFGCNSLTDFDNCIRFDITPVIFNIKQLRTYLHLTKDLSLAHKRVALKFDSGMNRLGFSLAGLDEALAVLGEFHGMRVEWLISHLAHASGKERAEEWRRVDEAYGHVLPHYELCKISIGATAGVARREERKIKDREVWTRPGIALYGVNPPGMKIVKKIGLQPVMALNAPILEIREISAGESVSYEGKFKAERDMTIAIVAMGYANGVMREWSGKISLRVNNHLCQQIGLICMNMLMIDVTGLNPRIGDLAWLVNNGWEDNSNMYTEEYYSERIEGIDGETVEEKWAEIADQEESASAPDGAAAELTINSLADATGALPYELLTSFGNLNPAVYIR